MADQVPPLGHIPRIFERMNADNDAIPKSCVEVVNSLAVSEVSHKLQSSITRFVSMSIAAPVLCAQHGQV